MGDAYPFVVMAVGVAFVVVAIIRFRLHAFVALIIAAFIVGLLSYRAVGGTGNAAVAAIEQSAREFGSMAGNIGIVIVMASIIGKCLMDSGAADVITRRFLRLLGVERAPIALLGSGYLLSVPVFFDTVFYLLIPLAKAFRLRTGGHYLFYVMAICAGGVLTHSLVAPTPGPLVMASNLHLNLGTTIIAGIAFSIAPAILVGFHYARWLSERYPVPLRQTPDMHLDDLEAQMDRPDGELPPFWLSMLPIILPVAMIAASTVADTLDASSRAAGGAGLEPLALQAFGFFGNRNIAMLASAAVAIVILLRQPGKSMGKAMAEMEPAIASAGIIILITSAGGAFGAMIRHAGVGDVIKNYVGSGAPGATLLLVAFLIAAVMKSAQGSSTVSMITTSSIMFGVIDGATLPYHPVYVFLAIGFGALLISWMNDSGFWVVCKMSGLTETETLKTWTTTLALIGLIGLVEVLLLSTFLPLGFLP
jgi:gluconate:H+ symporter, GntP family